MVSVAQFKKYEWDAGGTLTFDSTPTAGHLLVVAYGHRAVALPSMSGYTQTPESAATALNSDACTIWYKTASGSETNITGLNDSMSIWWAELDTGGTLNVHAKAQDAHDGSTSTTPTTAGVSAANGDFCLAVATEGTDGGWGSASFTPPGGWTEAMDNDNPTDHPTVGVFYKVSAGASENCAPTCTSSGYWSAQIATFTPSGGGGGSGRSAGIINLAKKLIVPERKIWLPT
jgi:hypothetical protein